MIQRLKEILVAQVVVMVQAVVLVSPSSVNHAEIESRLFGRHVGVMVQLSRLDPRLGNLELELEYSCIFVSISGKSFSPRVRV